MRVMDFDFTRFPTYNVRIFNSFSLSLPTLVTREIYIPEMLKPLKMSCYLLKFPREESLMCEGF